MDCFSDRSVTASVLLRTTKSFVSRLRYSTSVSLIDRILVGRFSAKVERALARFLCQSDECLPYWNVLRDVQDIADEGISLRPRRIRPALVLSPFPDQNQRYSGTKRCRKQGLLIDHLERQVEERGGGQGVIGLIRPTPALYSISERKYGETISRAGWNSERRTFQRRLNSIDACGYSVVLNGPTVVLVWCLSLPQELGCLNNSLC